MTFPTITSVSTFGVNSNTILTCTYPSLDSGDLAIVYTACDGTGDLLSFPTGDLLTNQLYKENSNGIGRSLSYVIADGANSPSGTFELTCTATQGITAFIIRIANWHGTTPPETSPRGISSNDDWNTITAWGPGGWDSSADDTLWIAYIGTDGTSVNVSGYPSDFPDNRQYYNFSSGSPTITICSVAELAATQTFNDANVTFSKNVLKAESIFAIRGAVAGGGSIIPQIMHHRRMMQ